MGCVSGKSRRIETDVARVVKEGVPRFSDSHLQMVPVPVPSLPPTMTGNRCIHIIYTLKVGFIASDSTCFFCIFFYEMQFF